MTVVPPCGWVAAIDRGGTVSVGRTTFRLRRHNRTRVDEIADQHLKERKQRRRPKLAVC